MRLKADLTLLAVSIVWGVAFLAQHFSAVFGSVYLYNGFGFLIAALILLAINYKRVSVRPGQWLWMSVAGTALVIASALQQLGIFTTDLANAGFLTSLFFPFSGSVQRRSLRLADCYHRLIYYDRSNGSLNVDSFPLAGGQFRHSEIIKNDSHLRT